MATETTKGVSADRIKNDPIFERTRENNAEFTRSGKAAKLLRNIFREVMVNAKDKITHARLVKVLARVVATDPVNGRGERVVSKGDLFQLQQFNFNVKAGMGEILFAKYAVNLDRTTGTVEITIPAFVPRVMVQAPRGTTHYKLVLAAASVNFDTEAYDYASQATAELPWGQEPTAPTSLLLTLPPGGTNPILVVLGMEFYQQVNGRSYALKTGELNASTIIKVDKA